MNLDTMLHALGLTQESAAAARLIEQLPATAPGDWARLAVALGLRCRQRGTRLLAIGGGQGAGKTTLAGLLRQVLRNAGIRALSLSIDDFYLPRAARRTLAREIHPLLLTRGVPGTHDVALALAVLEDLLAGRCRAVPSFDKARDERSAAMPVDGPVDVVIFEGWCLGARPQADADLVLPCNSLERDEDADGRWRSYVNERLRDDYPALWQLFEDLLFLAVPGLDAVRRWRADQEAGLPEGLRMDAVQLTRFIAHYERLTGWMLIDMPRHADMTGCLDENHGLAGIQKAFSL